MTFFNPSKRFRCEKYFVKASFILKNELKILVPNPSYSFIYEHGLINKHVMLVLGTSLILVLINQITLIRVN